MSSKSKYIIDYENEVKECSMCNEMLPFSEFHKSSHAKVGLSPECKTCHHLRKGYSRRNNYSIDYDKQLKSCPKCGEVLPFSEFDKNASTTSGLFNYCKDCNNLRRGYSSRRKERRVDYEQEVKECTMCEKLLSFSSFSKDASHRDGLGSRCKQCESLANGRTPMKRVTVDYEAETKTCSQCDEMLPFSSFPKASRHKTGRASACRRCKSLTSSTPDHLKKERNYRNKRRAEDPIYKLRVTLRSRLKSALGYIKRGKKVGSAVRDLGCSVEYLKEYLESKFYDRTTGEQMTWANHSLYGWHVDHIKPLAAFDLMDREQLLEAVHYTNLQPLWAEDNLAKGDTYNV